MLLKILIYCTVYVALSSRFEIFHSGNPLYMIFCQYLLWGASFWLTLFEQLTLWRHYLLFLDFICFLPTLHCLWIIDKFGHKLKRVSQQCFKLLMIPPAVKSSAYASVLTLLLEKDAKISKTINNKGITAIVYIAIATGSPCVVPSTERISYPSNINQCEGSV